MYFLHWCTVQKTLYIIGFCTNTLHQHKNKQYTSLIYTGLFYIFVLLTI